MLSIVLLVAVLVIVLGSAVVLKKAPPQLRVTAIIAIVAGCAIGAVGGYFAASDSFTRDFYPIAGAFVGWIIGAAIYDNKRKRALAAR